MYTFVLPNEHEALRLAPDGKASTGAISTRLHIIQA